MSRNEVDPLGSKLGPKRVQTIEELQRFFLRLYPTKTAEQVAADLRHVSHTTVRKWLFRKPQREPNHVSRQHIARVYGPALAAEAKMPLEAWREAFLFPEAIAGRAA